VPDDPDLGALLHGLLARVVAREEPILARHGVSMWEYVVLTVLADTPAPTQARLAELSGRDKTRLITHLDRLERDGLVHRAPDPDDRRNRVVTVTPKGRRVWSRCRADIRAMEDDLLGALPERRRAGWRRDLATIAAQA
jgi:DNA-binding MarR family transcriptional regulator